jgi:hypothetical protein
MIPARRKLTRRVVEICVAARRPGTLPRGMINELIAQAFPAPGPNPPPPGPELFIILGVVLFVALLISAVVCYLLYITQKAVPPEHRKIEPGMVWLLMIPLFNLVWNFFVFLRIPDSFQSYFYSRGRTDVGDAGKNLGLWYSICSLLVWIPCLGNIAGIAALVLLIMFLVRVMGYRKQVGMVAPGGFPVGYGQPGAFPTNAYPPMPPPPPGGFPPPPPPPPRA